MPGTWRHPQHLPVGSWAPPVRPPAPYLHAVGSSLDCTVTSGAANVAACCICLEPKRASSILTCHCKTSSLLPRPACFSRTPWVRCTSKARGCAALWQCSYGGVSLACPASMMCLSRRPACVALVGRAPCRAEGPVLARGVMHSQFRTVFFFCCVQAAVPSWTWVCLAVPTSLVEDCHMFDPEAALA